MTNIKNSLALAFLPGYLYSSKYEEQIQKNVDDRNPPVTKKSYGGKWSRFD